MAHNACWGRCSATGQGHFPELSRSPATPAHLAGLYWGDVGCLVRPENVIPKGSQPPQAGWGAWLGMGSTREPGKGGPEFGPSPLCPLAAATGVSAQNSTSRLDSGQPSGSISHFLGGLGVSQTPHQSALRQPRGVAGERAVHEGGDICLHMADSC